MYLQTCFYSLQCFYFLQLVLIHLMIDLPILYYEQQKKNFYNCLFLVLHHGCFFNGCSLHGSTSLSWLLLRWLFLRSFCLLWTSQNVNKFPLGETGCLSNPYFLLTGCLGIQFFDSTNLFS